MDYDESQVEAIEGALSNTFRIITGGAGTGKTTLIKEIAENTTCATLCAPTGKAASRLREATGIESRTIHSLMKYNGSKFMVKSLAGMHIIVDESSMVDSWLMASIITRNPRQLTLVGDNAQLFPVGPGAPFHDIITLKPEKVANLTTCYRSSEAVCAAGNKVREGQFPGFDNETENERWQFKEQRNPEEVEQVILDMVSAGEIDFSQDIIICPKNGKVTETTGKHESCTVNGLNPIIQNMVNPHDTDDKFDTGDRVICGKNFADEDVWNGTTGLVHSVDHRNNIWVQTDTPTRDPDNPGEYRNQVKFTKDMTKSTKHAYALTVHKAQGSQYRKVVVICLSRDMNMLTRPLLYTAITRAQKECIVIGERWAFEKALGDMPERNTVMKEIARS
jgi:exodeoxyribonuclease V alpha subunit